MKTIHSLILATAIILIAHPVTPENPKKPLPFQEWQARVAAHIANLNARTLQLQRTQLQLAQAIASCQQSLTQLANTPVKYRPIFVQQPGYTFPAADKIAEEIHRLGTMLLITDDWD